MPDEPVTVAYLNWGRWVADCPHCHSALALGPGQSAYYCQPPVGCGGHAAIQWPEETAEVNQAYGTGGVISEFDAVNPRQSWKPGDPVGDTP